MVLYLSLVRIALKENILFFGLEYRENEKLIMFSLLVGDLLLHRQAFLAFGVHMRPMNN